LGTTFVEEIVLTGQLTCGGQKDADLVGNLIRWKKDATVPDFDGLDKLVTALIPGTIQFVPELESMTFLTNSVTRRRIYHSLRNGNNSLSHISAAR
jgi:hypothetical protein